MNNIQKRNLLILILISLAIFVLYSIPNSRASDNIAMIRIFDPDEVAPLPNLQKMIMPADSIKQSIKQFLFNNYYYYGFPHFAYSATILLPLKWLGLINDMPTVMLFLRQGNSVLLMLISLLLLVYMHDRFKSYRSIVMFGFLAIVPAVVRNNFWWHPDGLVTLFAVLTIFFLKRDSLRLGPNFLLAAVMCGILTAIKIVGVFFFLAVGMVLIISLIKKKVSFVKFCIMALVFVVIMGITFMVSNPFLFFASHRTVYIRVFKKQTLLLGYGYGIVYTKGLAVSWPLMREFYGEAVFLVVALGAALWGIIKGKNQLLHALIVAWFIPVTVTILTMSHFKFQYWLPVALPLLSCLIVTLPLKIDFKIKPKWQKVIQASAICIFVIQSILFLQWDIGSFINRTNRAENSQAIQFYNQTLYLLEPLFDEQMNVYFDARMYLPHPSGWRIETSYDLLEYRYIQEKKFDILLLMEQRIRDYLNPAVEGIDPDTFARNQQFYRDADNGDLSGYKLIYRDSFGLIFIKENLQNCFDLTD